MKLFTKGWVVGVLVFLLVLPNALFWFPTNVLAAGNACTSNATGNWNTAGTWTSCGGTVPQAADTVTILNTHTVTLNTSPTVVDVTINTGGTLTVSASNTLTLTGSWSNSGTFTAGTGTVIFTATTGSKTLSGTLNGSSSFYKVKFDAGLGNNPTWTITDPMKVSAANATDTLLILNGTITVGNGNADNLEVDGETRITNANDQTATLQTMSGLAQGSTIIIDINANTSTPTCANCFVDVGEVGGSGAGQGNFILNKNSILRLNMRTAATASSTSVIVGNQGKFQVLGSQDTTGTDTGTDASPVTLRETTLCANQVFTASQHNGKNVRMTSGLATGYIYDISATGVNDTNCATNTDDSLTINDTSIPAGSSVATMSSFASSGLARKICSNASTYITADRKEVGRYVHDLTQNKYLQITGSTNDDSNITNGCSGNDSFKVMATPDSFTGVTAGDTFKIVDGIKSGDTFQVLDYASVTAQNGTACDAAPSPDAAAYIATQNGSESIFQYGDFCNLGGDNRSSIFFDQTDGSHANEGVTIDTSRFRNSSSGTTLALNNSSNNNTGNGKGVSNSLVSGNTLGHGIGGGTNSTFTGNISMNNSNIGFIEASSSGDTLTSNKAIGNGDLGFLVFAGSDGNNILTSNTSYGNANAGFEIDNSNNTLTSNTANGNGSYGITTDASNNTFISNTTNGNGTKGVLNGANRSNNTFTSNTANANNFYGFEIGGTNNTITSNTANYNSVDGFKLSSASNNTLNSNTANNNDVGFEFSNSSNNVLSSNTASSNTTTGFDLQSSATNNRLVSNTAASNSYGISDAGSGTTVIGGSYTGSSTTDVFRAANFTTPALTSLFGVAASTLDPSSLTGGYELAAGKTASQVIGVAYDNWNDGRLAVFYNDGTYSVSPANFDVDSVHVSLPTLYNYTLAAGKTAAMVVGITQEAYETGYLAVFYNDGTYSSSSSDWRSNADISVPDLHTYTLSAGHLFANVIGIEQDVWNTGKLAAFYSDGTFSVSDLEWDDSGAPTLPDIALPTNHNYTLAAGKTAGQVMEISNDYFWNGDLAVWYNDGTYSVSIGDGSGWSADADIAANILYDSSSTSKSAIISKRHNNTAGLTKIGGQYITPNQITETPQDETTDKYNYANNVYEKSATAHGYSGTGTEDTDLNYDLSTADLSAGPYAYRLVVKTAGTANCASAAVLDVFRNGTDVGDATCGTQFTDSTGGVNVKFKVDGGATGYAIGDTYTFVAFAASGDTSTQKTVTFLNDGDSLTTPTGHALQLKGQDAAHPTLISRASTGGYHLIVAGTIDAQYYQFSYLGGTNGANGLDLQSGATVTNLANGTFNNYQNVGGSDTYLKVDGSLVGTGTPAKTWANNVFTRNSSNPEFSIKESGGSPSAGNYWLFDQASCSGWSNCEASDSDAGDGAGSPNQAGFMRFVDVFVADTTPPVITMLGSTPVTISVGDAYTDAGATASDNIDGDITGTIQTVSTVNTAVAGSYSVTYTVSDAALNAATPVVRSVIVQAASASDTIAPTLTIQSIPSHSSDSSVVVSGTATDNVSVASVTVNDTAVSLAGDGSFSISVNLNLGTNTITVKAVDPSGNTTTRILTVFRNQFINPISPGSKTTIDPSTNAGKAQILSSLQYFKGLFNKIDKAIISALQNLLQKLGYFKVKVTGYFGTVTRSAVKHFQKDHGLAQTGAVDIHTLAALDSYSYTDNPTDYLSAIAQDKQGLTLPELTFAKSYSLTKDLKPGQRSLDVKVLQEKLYILKYFAGPATGYFSSQTISAVRAYKKDHHLSTKSSTVDSAMRALLNGM